MYFQLGSTLLDACVLGVLQKGDTYGYSLTQNIKEIISISDSTMYPVLRRLQKEGLLITYDQPYQGRNRRYYTITNEGKQKHAEYATAWHDYKQKVDRVMLGGGEYEQG